MYPAQTQLCEEPPPPVSITFAHSQVMREHTSFISSDASLYMLVIYIFFFHNVALHCILDLEWLLKWMYDKQAKRQIWVCMRHLSNCIQEISAPSSVLVFCFFFSLAVFSSLFSVLPFLTGQPIFMSAVAMWWGRGIISMYRAWRICSRKSRMGFSSRPLHHWSHSDKRDIRKGWAGVSRDNPFKPRSYRAWPNNSVLLLR